MSFAALRDARRAKESRSVVKSDSDQATSTAATLSSVPTNLPSLSWPVVSSGPYSISSSIEIRRTPHAGRTLVATTVLRPGQVIHACTPHVHVLSSVHLDVFCSTCTLPAVPPTALKRCSKCSVVHYCSSACQTADWKDHKAECSGLLQWAKEAPNDELRVPGEAVRCLARILRAKARHGPEHNWTKQVGSMQSLRGSLPPAAAESHTHLAHAIVRFMGLAGPPELVQFGITSAGELVDMISQFTTNSFTLSSPSLDPIGVCVSPSIALANHACAPNAAVTFPHYADTPREREPRMVLIALREIALGEEVLAAYIDVSQPRHIRRSQLSETYGFKCECSLCISTTPATPDPRWGIACPKNCGGICALPDAEEPEAEHQPMACNHCGCRYSGEAQEEALDRVRIGCEAAEKATALERSDPERALRLTKNALALLGSLSPPSSHPTLALLRLHVSLLIASGGIGAEGNGEFLDEAITVAFRAQAGMQDAFPAGHPVRGVALAELGKLLAVDAAAPTQSAIAQASTTMSLPPPGPARLRLALQTHVRARTELLVGFGVVGGAHMVKIVEEMIKMLERELQIWDSGVKNVADTYR